MVQLLCFFALFTPPLELFSSFLCLWDPYIDKGKREAFSLHQKSEARRLAFRETLYNHTFYIVISLGAKKKMSFNKQASEFNKIPISGITSSDTSNGAIAIPSERPTCDSSDNMEEKQLKRKRRNTIPLRPNHSLNLWSFMKNAIGKELTKIPMPVSTFLPVFQILYSFFFLHRLILMSPSRCCSE